MDMFTRRGFLFNMKTFVCISPKNTTKPRPALSTLFAQKFEFFGAPYGCNSATSWSVVTCLQ